MDKRDLIKHSCNHTILSSQHPQGQWQGIIRLQHDVTIWYPVIIGVCARFQWLSLILEVRLHSHCKRKCDGDQFRVVIHHGLFLQKWPPCVQIQYLLHNTCVSLQPIDPLMCIILGITSTAGYLISRKLIRSETIRLQTCAVESKNLIASFLLAWCEKYIIVHYLTLRGQLFLSGSATEHFDFVAGVTWHRRLSASAPEISPHQCASHVGFFVRSCVLDDATLLKVKGRLAGSSEGKWKLQVKATIIDEFRKQNDEPQSYAVNLCTKVLKKTHFFQFRRLGF